MKEGPMVGPLNLWVGLFCHHPLNKDCEIAHETGIPFFFGLRWNEMGMSGSVDTWLGKNVI